MLSYQVLESDGESAAGGHLIVLSDGGENASPYIRETRDDVLSKVSLCQHAFKESKIMLLQNNICVKHIDFSSDKLFQFVC